jgi:hypothetical protein
MRKIINGKLYDTDTAEPIYTELYLFKRRTLYRTKKGNWFMFYHANKEIRPMTDEEVMEYLGERDECIDIYLKYFGSVEEA